MQDSPKVTKRPSSDTSDSESNADPTEENSLQVTETIGGTITRLFRLSNAVRGAVKSGRALEIESYNDKNANKAMDELRLYTRSYIESRFPEAPETLRSALVEANVWRLRRLCCQQSYRKRRDMSIQGPSITPSAVQLSKVTGSMPAVRSEPSPLPTFETNNAPFLSPAPVTSATTAPQTTVTALYARSTTESSRAESVLVNDRVSFPPMPSNGQCNYCGVIIELNTAASSLLWQ